MEGGSLLFNKTVYNSHFLKIVHKSIKRNVIVVPKKNIKKAVLRVRMRRKVKATIRNVNLKGIFLISFVKTFCDFNQSDIEKIQKKINQYVEKTVQQN